MSLFCGRQLRNCSYDTFSTIAIFFLPFSFLVRCYSLTSQSETTKLHIPYTVVIFNCKIVSLMDAMWYEFNIRNVSLPLHQPSFSFAFLAHKVSELPASVRPISGHHQGSDQVQDSLQVL